MRRKLSYLATSALVVVGIGAGTASSLATTVYTYTYTGSIQTWTVPTTGRYSVEAIGAQGGSATPGFSGGLGAEVIGDFSFVKGQTYQYAVGGVGTSDGCSAGGGGGTFFVTSTGTPLIVAGGGGGIREQAR